MNRSDRIPKVLTLNTALGPKTNEIFVHGKLEQKMMDLQLSSYQDVMAQLTEDVAKDDGKYTIGKRGRVR